MDTLAPFVVGMLLVALIASSQRGCGALSGFDKAATIPLRGVLAIAAYSAASLLTYFLPSHTPVISELPYACLGPVCYLLISFWGTIPDRVLRWLGREAYEIYLLHGVFLFCLKPLAVGNLEWGLLSVLATVVCAWPLHWAHGQIIRFLRE